MLTQFQVILASRLIVDADYGHNENLFQHCIVELTILRRTESLLMDMSLAPRQALL